VTANASANQPVTPPPLKQQPLALGSLALTKLVGAVLLGVVILIFAGYFIIYLRYTAALIQFPYDYDQGEGFELNDVVLFAHGQWPYRSNEVYPFYASNYPPLYHLWLVPFEWVFGPAYWYGRLFSFLSTLVTAGAIGWAVYRAARDRPIGLIAGLAYLSSNYVYHIGPLFRQHISMVMFETLAVVILAPLKTEDTQAERWRIFWGLLCLLAAGYTKQLAYATVAVCLLFIVWRGLKRGLIASAIFAGVAAALFGLINLATSGQWWLNIILANINEFIPGQMEGLFKQWYGLHFFLIWLSIIFVGIVIGLRVYYAIKHIPVPDQAYALYALWFLGAVANSTLAGKWGAGESYFMTSVAAMCVCTGLLLAEWRRLTANRQPLYRWATALAIPAVLIMQGNRFLHLPTQGKFFETLAQVLDVPPQGGGRGARTLELAPTPRTAHTEPGNTVIGDAGVFVDSEGRVQYYDSQGYTQLGRPPNQIDTEQGNKILAYVKAATGPVLTEEAAFSLLAGKEQVGNPTQLYNLAKLSLLDSTALVEMIKRREFSIIVLKAEFYPLPVLQAIGQNYQSVETVPMNGFYYRVLKPRP